MVAPGRFSPGRMVVRPCGRSTVHPRGQRDASLAGTRRCCVTGCSRLRHTASTASGVLGLTLRRRGMPG